MWVLQLVLFVPLLWLSRPVRHWLLYSANWPKWAADVTTFLLLLILWIAVFLAVSFLVIKAIKRFEEWWRRRGNS